MSAIQAHDSPFIAETIQTVASVCSYHTNSLEYARQLVQALAVVTDSEYAVWLNWPASPDCVVAESDYRGCLSRCLMREAHFPLLSNEWSASGEITSVAAAPIRFRNFVVGVLALANSSRPYVASDLTMLEEVGAIGIAEYESRRRKEALRVPDTRSSLPELVHGLRQPLGILEACAFLLDTSLAPGETRAREHLGLMRRQLERASGILQEISAVYTPRRSRPCDDEKEPGVGDNLVRTNSAMSMVT